MAFTLEALQAKHGDALLLHWGDDRLAVIDGGPSGVFRTSMRPRLQALQQERDVKTLPIRMLMVSHIDDDHIHGVLDLTNFLGELDKDKKPRPWKIDSLWHNSFDGVVGNVEPLAALSAAVAPVATGGAIPAGVNMDYYSALVLASVAQGKELRADARALKLPVNQPFKGLVWAPEDEKRQVELGDGLKFTIVGPLETQVKDLQKAWDEKLEEMRKKKSAAEAQAIAAAFVDKSVYNLSSIAVLATHKNRTMLLTGDARGDFLLDGLRAAKLMKNDALHVDLLKVPHHGSDRNVDPDFFRRITADHYVISADGKHDNPDPKMLKMLAEARGSAEYTVALTNRVPAAEDFFKADKPKGRKYKVVYRDDDALSVAVSLGG